MNNITITPICASCERPTEAKHLVRLVSGEDVCTECFVRIREALQKYNPFKKS